MSTVIHTTWLLYMVALNVNTEERWTHEPMDPRTFDFPQAYSSKTLLLGTVRSTFWVDLRRRLAGAHTGASPRYHASTYPTNINDNTRSTWQCVFQTLHAWLMADLTISTRKTIQTANIAQSLLQLSHAYSFCQYV